MAVQSDVSLATNINNTYIALAEGFCSNGAGISSRPVVMQVGQFTPNTNPPALLECTFDQQSRMLGLLFSEGVLLDSFIPTGVSLSLVNLGTGLRENLTLTGGSVAYLGMESSLIGVTLLSVDYATLSTGTTNADDFVVALSANSVSDANGMQNLFQSDVMLVAYTTDSLNPIIDGFSLDLNVGNIMLTFSESVANSIDYSLLYLTNQSEISPSVLRYTLNGSSTAALGNGTVALIQLAGAALSAIIAESGICTTTLNCYMLWQNGTFFDLSANPSLSPQFAVQADVVIGDISPPYLVAFNINLQTGTLELFFSELIVVNTLSVSSFILTNNGSSSSITGSIQTSSLSPNSLSRDITILLSFSSLNFAKLLGTPRMAAQSEGVSDSSGNALIAIPVSSSLEPTVLVQDVTPPVLVNFVPDAAANRITFLFDEYVNPASWNGNRLSLTLQVSTGDFYYTMFTGGELSANPAENVTYIFSATEFSLPFMEQYSEAIQMGAIFLTADAGLIQDISGNELGMSTTLTYSVLPPDVTNPNLDSFSLDMNVGILQMTFSEPVYVLSRAGDLVTFLSMNTSSPSASQRHSLLDNGTSSQNQSTGSLRATINMSPMDVNSLKLNRHLCTAIPNCYLSVLPGLAIDRSGNSLQHSVIIATEFTQDAMPPVLTSFVVDLGRSHIMMTFSEPILIELSTPNFTRLQLTGNSASTPGINLSSTNVTTASALSTVVEAAFSAVVLNAIILDMSVCSNSSNCRLSVAEAAFMDTNLNSVMSGVVDMGTVLPDTTSPSLLSFDLDFDNGMLTLSFDELVDFNTFNPMHVNFTNLMPYSSVSLNAVTFVSSGVFSPVVVVTIVQLSLNNIKIIYSTSAENFGLSISSSAITDVAGNPVLPTGFLRPSTIELDMTAPEVNRFIPEHSMSPGVTFYFTEAVNTSAFEETEFTLNLRTRLGLATYTRFTGGSILQSSASDVINYMFSQHLNTSFRGQYQEAIINGSVSLSVTSLLVRDLFGNTVNPIPSSNPLQFTNDVTRPILTSFSLDLNRRAIYLFFSEPIVMQGEVETLEIWSSIIGGSTYMLTSNATLDSGNGASESVTVLLNQDDVTALTLNPQIATSVDNTFIRIRESYAADVSGNGIQNTTLQASELVLDSTAPTVLSFAFDANRGVLTLHFSELITLVSLDPLLLLLTSSSVGQSSGYNLNGSHVIETGISMSASLMLTAFALNSVKSDSRVCSTATNCSLQILSDAFSDLSGNQAVFERLVSPEIFIPDTTPPVLLAFSLDLDRGSIAFTFSEPVLLETVNPSSISLHSQTQSESLGSAVQVERVENYASEITMSINLSIVLDRLKVLSSQGPITLSLTDNFIRDTSYNSLVPVLSTMPTELVPDVTSPLVVDFVPSAGTPLSFLLVFDEPVQDTSVNASLLSFTLKNRFGHFNYSDFSRASMSAVGSQVSISFPLSETRFTDINFQELYLRTYTAGYICLNLTPGFVDDVSGNAYSGALVVVYTNTTDQIPPQLLSFSLDLNRGFLNLTFTEDVTVLSIKGNARLESSVTLPIVYELNQERDILYAANATTSSLVSVLLNSTDLAILINSPSIGSSVANTYLLLQEQFAIDGSGNFLNTSGIVVQASQVVQFVVGTSVTQFTLDLDSDILTIDFDKNVNISTFNSNRLALSNASDLSSSSQDIVQLGAVDVLTEPSSQVTSFRFLLRVNDVVRIKSSSVCSVAPRCFGSFMAGLILDATGNSTRPAYLQVSSLISDVTPPRLVAYTSFDLNRGAFTLAFSEPVDGSSAEFSDIALWDQAMTPAATLALMPGIAVSRDIQVEFHLAVTDLNLIKSQSTICTSAANCWIRLLSFFIYDFGGNPFLHSNLAMGATSSLHSPLVFIPDRTSPILTLFSVDINNGSLYLSFSEVIDDSTFMPQDITLLSSPGGTTSLQLSSTTSIARSGPTQVIFFSFTQSDLNQIKSLTLYTSRANSYLSLVTTSLMDTSGNLAENIPSSQALQASAFNTDLSQPQVVSFDEYNNDQGYLILRFNEPIDIDTFLPTQLTLYSQPILQSSQFTLTGGTPSYFTGDGLTVSLSLTAGDLRSVKINTGLATSRESTYITISSSAVSDRQGNPVQPLLLPLQLSANGYVSDTSRASVEQYTLNLNTGFISMSFSDVMNFSSFDPTSLTLQNQRSEPTESYSLKTSLSSQRISDTLSFQMSMDDYNNILSNTNLATSSSNTFLSFGDDLVQDVGGQAIISAPTSDALPPENYVEDQTLPAVASFNLDLNSGILLSTFSEPIVVGSIRLSSMQIQTSEQAIINRTFSLGMESFMESSENTLLLTINFTIESLNRIKSIGFQSRDSTFLSVVSTFAMDTTGNSFQPGAIQVGTYTRDSVPPLLLDFDLNSNENNNALQLYFSEAISFTPTAALSITLQSAAFNPSIVRHLSTANTIQTLPTLHTLEVTILESSLIIALLNNPGFASSTMNLFISVSAEGFRDFAGNDVAVIPSDNAKRVRYICKCVSRIRH